MRVIGAVVAVILLLGIGVVANMARQSGDPEPSATPALTFQARNIPSELRVLVEQREENSDKRRYAICEERQCHTYPWPRSGGSEAVTNGQNWYFYQDDNLVQQPIGGKDSHIIVTKNPLVAPRDLLPNPAGSHIAYWLDNIHDEKKELSELWLYSEAEKGTRLLVENVVRPDALTTPRWNSAGTHLWYIADSGKKDEKKIELIVVSAQPPEAAARFKNVLWQLHQSTAAGGIMDISFTGRSVAFAEEISSGRTQLTVAHEGSEPSAAVIRGRIPFLTWVEDGSIIYVVEDSSDLPAGRQGYSFWRLRSTVHTLLGKENGKFLAARSDASGEYVVVASEQNKKLTLRAFHTAFGVSDSLVDVPEFGDTINILRLERQVSAEESASQNREISAKLEDSELTAFVEKNLKEITGDPAVTPRRLITTSEPNVVFVDYRASGSSERRILLTVRDAVYTEWSIRARYEPAGGEWRKTQGGGLPDPSPKNVYEWEQSVNQWILKSGSSAPLNVLN